MKPFYNTNKLSGEDLTKANENALSQEKEIMEFFKANPESCFTTRDIEDLLSMNHDSCKRAITNLTKKGKLIKSENRVPGYYGYPVHVWSLNKEVQVNELKEAA